MSKTVIGVFKESNAEIALNNLTEADFDKSLISIIMKGSSADIADVSGSTNNTPAEKTAEVLIKIGVNKAEAENYQKYVNDGWILIAISTENAKIESISLEMLKDNNGILINSY